MTPLRLAAALLPFVAALAQLAWLGRYALRLRAALGHWRRPLDRLARDQWHEVGGTIHALGPTVTAVDGARCLRIETRFAAIVQETHTSAGRTQMTTSTEWIGLPTVEHVEAELRQGDTRCRVELSEARLLESTSTQLTVDEFLQQFPDLRPSVPPNTTGIERHESRLLDGASALLRGFAREDDTAAPPSVGYRQPGQAPPVLGAQGERPPSILPTSRARLVASSVPLGLVLLGITATMLGVAYLSLCELLAHTRLDPL